MTQRISRDHPLLLASASPRRRELLELARIPFEVIRGGIDESVAKGEHALAYVARMARAKLAAAVVPLDEATRARSPIVLAADTTVICDDRIFGKPENDDEAREMLRTLSGAKHDVVTAFALGDPKTGRLVCEQSVSTQVEFRVLDAQEIDGYVSTAEPRDKAGGYAIQGMASVLVRRIDGSHTNVIGLPTAELFMELRRLELM